MRRRDKLRKETMDNNNRTRVRAEALKVFCRQLFEKLGVSEEDARIVAEVLVASDLRGIESHGVARLRTFYVNRIREGAVPARPPVQMVHETPVTAVIDGGGGLGHPTSYRAMKLAIDKAVSVGAGFVTVRNSNHFGIAGYYAMMALERGCIGMAMTNGNRWVVPTFGRDAMLGTNPIALAAPSGREHPFVLDMATSTAAVGKVEIAERQGKAIPLGWATDKDGLPTTEPGPLLHDVRASIGGGMLPLGGAGELMGGHKGYGLAAWVDIFCGPLAGGAYADQIFGLEAPGARRPGILGHFFGAWQVEAFQPLGSFQAALDDWQQRLKGSHKAEGQDRIYVAGEKEFEEAGRRQRDGIPLQDVVLADLQALGGEFGIALGTAETKPG
jgi:L-2-hydroxycarboxylate dehydrogenase (NAD+)